MARPKRGINAYILYRFNKRQHIKRLWVMQLEQAHQLQGNSAQSRFTRHFYPRSYAPGAMQVTGRCRTEKEYQELARFIRTHQRRLITSPYNFARLAHNAKGYQLLMKLGIPDEGVSLRGWIPNFNLSKRGVFNPAPEFTFQFDIAFDPHSTPIEVSHALRKWYGPGRGDIDPMFSESNIPEGLEAQDIIERNRLDL